MRQQLPCPPSHSAPSKALDFFAFDSFKRMLGGNGSYLHTFAAAGLAGVGEKRARVSSSRAGGCVGGKGCGLAAAGQASGLRNMGQEGKHVRSGRAGG